MSYISIADFAKRIGLSKQRVYQLCESGKLKTVQFGKVRLVEVAEAEKWKKSTSKDKRSKIRRIIACLVLFLVGACGLAFADVDVERLIDAIGKAENSYNHPYGILRDYCKPGDPDGQCRKGCKQTINKWLKRLSYKSEEDFIRQFGAIYCPVGATNDPTGLNNHWVKNVTYFYNSKG